MVVSTKAATFLKVLYNRYHPGSLDTLSDCLGESYVQKLGGIACPSKDPKAALIALMHVLEGVHFSWLIEPIQKLPKSNQPFVLAALTEEQQKGLRELMEVEIPKVKWIAGFREYVLKDLMDVFFPKAMLSPTHLPETELTFLTRFNKHQLIKLVDCLGVNDLSFEMKRVIDTARLNKIEEALNPTQKLFLRDCLVRHPPRIQGDLSLTEWSGIPEELRKRLHLNGIAHLGQSLSGQHPQMVWQIMHLFDTGRGRQLRRYVSKQSKEGITELFVEQVIRVVNFLHQGVK